MNNLLESSMTQRSQSTCRLLAWRERSIF